MNHSLKNFLSGRIMRQLRAILFVSASIAFFCNAATADFFINDFSITSDTVSFNVAGQLNGPFPNESADTLFFVNGDVFAVPGFVLPDDSFQTPLSVDWTGDQALNTAFPLFTANPDFGDYFGIRFQNDLAVGELFSGNLTAQFAPNTFDPDAVSAIDVFWGDDGFSAPVDSGTFQTSINVVPEPTSGGALITLGLVCLHRKRRKVAL